LLDSLLQEKINHIIFKMPKRDATSELNHDNWDKEDESEEAGEFKKASEDQMKGRVIKKAKRRNLTEDQKKNIFSSFGGFTSTNNVNAADAFSFLAKPSASAPSDTAEKPSLGFVSGSNGAASNITDDKKEEDKKEEVAKDESNNKEENKENDILPHSKKAEAETPAAPVDDLFAKFTKKAAGSWICDVCMLSNPGDADKCLACESPRPGAKISSNASGGSVSEPKTEKVVAPPMDDLFAKFTKKAAGNWICDVCMLSNPGDADKCIACETPRPGAKITSDASAATSAAPTFQMGAGGGFKFGSGPSSSTAIGGTSSGFKFGESAKPDSASSSTTGGFKFGGGNQSSSDSSEKSTPGGFKFGGGTQSSESSDKSNLGGFTFGSTVTETKEEKTNGGFTFGSSTADSSKKDDSSSKGGFTFGSKSEDQNKDESSSKGGFSFGSTSTEESSKNESGVKGGFSFASNDSNVASISNFKKDETSEKGSLVFGSTEPSTVSDKKIISSIFGSMNTPVAKGFNFSDKMGLKVDMNASDTPKTKSNKTEYLSNLKALNNQVTSWIKTHVDQNPLVDLTPVFKDYEKHIGELKTKFNIHASISEKPGVKEATKALTFGNTASPFGSNLGSNPSPFGSNSTPFGTGQQTTGGFSFGFLKSNESKTEENQAKNEDDNDEETEEISSPQKSQDPVIEEDALYSKKCKLFYKKGNEYQERGLGNIHLKQTDDKKLQLIIRAGTSLGNILLNIIVPSGCPVERMGKNNVMLVAVPNPPIDKKDDSSPVTFLIRVKTSEDADLLKQKITDLSH